MYKQSSRARVAKGLRVMSIGTSHTSDYWAQAGKPRKALRYEQISLAKLLQWLWQLTRKT